MSIYAVVENGIVTNLVEWDGESEWTPPSGSTDVLVPTNTFVDLGYSYSNGVFSAPAST